MNANNEITMELIEQVEETAQELVRRLDLVGGSKIHDQISYGQYKVLAVVGSHGPISVGNLGRMVGSAQSTTSEMIARLTRAGLVTKVRGPYDGRVVVVELTEEGRELLRKRRERTRDAYQVLFSRLTPAERDNFVSSLKNLEEILRKLTY